MKTARFIIWLIIIIPVLGWFVLGPGLSLYLQSNSPEIMREISVRTDDNVKLTSISGNFFSGILCENVIVYSDKNPEYLPLLTAQSVTIRLSLFNLLSGNYTPASIHLDGFNAVLHIDSNGKLILPEWKVADIFNEKNGLLLSGFNQGSLYNPAIKITCTNGVLEIYKKFPAISEMVDVTFTQLEGDGVYRSGDGVQVERMSGDYFGTPISVRGFVPFEDEDELEVGLNIGDIQLDTVFRDIDPLFRGSAYLPGGTASFGIHIGGSIKVPRITGSLEFKNSKFSNVAVDNATASVSYSAGVVDLTGITASAYGGTLEAAGTINLLSETPGWNATGNFQGIDLAGYLESNGYGAPYELDGNFSGDFTASGDFSSPASLECVTHISSEQGKFLSPLCNRIINPALGLSSDDPITPEEMAIYERIEIDARIRNRQIELNRFSLISYDLQVEGNGVIGFDHSIRAGGGLSVPVERAKHHPRFGRFVSMLPDSLNRASLRFDVRGTLSNPQFDASISENFLQGLLDSGSDLLHDIGGALSGSAE